MNDNERPVDWKTMTDAELRALADRIYAITGIYIDTTDLSPEAVTTLKQYSKQI